MALRRVFVDRITHRAAWVSGPRAHHLYRVARLRPGERVEISDYQKLFLASVKSSSAGEIEFEIEEELAAGAASGTVVLQLAVVRLPRLEWAIEKATELGVSAIVPVIAARSDRRLVEAARKRIGRWRKIAAEAAQQSRRLAPPQVDDPLAFGEVLRQATAPWRVILDRDAAPLARLLAEHTPGSAPEPAAALLAGPEGGWTEGELEAACQAGYLPAGLGPNILRSETAAVAAVSILAHLLHR